jgi:hypothetical protein
LTSLYCHPILSSIRELQSALILGDSLRKNIDRYWIILLLT